MASNRRTVSLEEIKRRAANLDGMLEDHREWQAIDARFRGVTSTELVEIWESGKNEGGKRLTKFERMALYEEWGKRFGCEPPSDTAEGSSPPPPDKPQPADDTMLHTPEVLRQVGTSLSGLKRLRRKGLFPEPTRISERRVGWQAGVVKAWVEERTNRQSGPIERRARRRVR